MSGRRKRKLPTSTRDKPARKALKTCSESAFIIPMSSKPRSGATRGRPRGSTRVNAEPQANPAPESSFIIPMSSKPRSRASRGRPRGSTRVNAKPQANPVFESSFIIPMSSKPRMRTSRGRATIPGRRHRSMPLSKRKSSSTITADVPLSSVPVDAPESFLKNAKPTQIKDAHKNVERQLADNEAIPEKIPEKMKLTTESIIWTDERQRISPCLSPPYRWICCLVITAQDGTQFLGSGAFSTMISDRPGLILTCAHNLYKPQSGFFRYVDVYPARDQRSAPLGQFRVYPSHFRIAEGYKRNGDPAEDYGVIFIPRSAFNAPKDVFGFGYQILDDADVIGQTVDVCGYPGDKKFGTLMIGGGRVGHLTDKKMFYDTDTYGGQSGSPVWKWHEYNFRMVGVHGYGVSDGRQFNSARRITVDFVRNVMQWAKEIPF